MTEVATAVERRKARLEQELARVVDVLIREYHPLQIIVFGSIARDQVHEWSDIDLAIIKETDKRFLDRIGEVLELTRSPVGLDVVVYNPQEFRQMLADGNYFVSEEILARGKTVYGPIS